MNEPSSTWLSDLGFQKRETSDFMSPTLWYLVAVPWETDIEVKDRKKKVSCCIHMFILHLWFFSNVSLLLVDLTSFSPLNSTLSHCIHWLCCVAVTLWSTGSHFLSLSLAACYEISDCAVCEYSCMMQGLSNTSHIHYLLRLLRK